MTDETCRHEDFAANVEVNRFVPPKHDNGRPDTHGRPDTKADPIAFNAEIRVVCASCGEPFVFHGSGIIVGMLNDRPCISPDGTELRVPLRPQSSDPHTGLGLPGFGARIREGGRGALN